MSLRVEPKSLDVGVDSMPMFSGDWFSSSGRSVGAGVGMNVPSGPSDGL